jgi:hypothetical protein
MKTNRVFYNLFLPVCFALMGFGLGNAAPDVTVKWSIDLKHKSVNYTVKNLDTAIVKWSSHLLVFCREDSDKSIIQTFATDPAYVADGVIHPYIEIITHPLKGSRIESEGGIMPSPIEIKPGESRDFSFSISDASIFNGDLTDISQIESASFQLGFDGKLIPISALNYVAGKWKDVAP